jgi:glycosyltransferase involved in cell wall biosynthesis
MEPLVSFVVPCYNYGRYLGDCLAGIFCQEGRHDFEIIAIDDGSTDNTQEVLRAFADPRLRVVTHPLNRGHVATINQGLSLARGAFIARIDPDDRHRPYFLSAVTEKFRAFPAVGMVYGDVAVMNDRGEITIERCDQEHGGRDFKGNELVRLMEKNFICAPSVTARREAWLNALPVPQWLAFNDWYFTLMMAREYEFYYIDQVLADYRVHDANHHHKVVLSKSEEPSVFRLLDHIFNEPEASPALEEQKQRAKRRIYGAQYLDMANKYFGCGFDSDARRCYMQALRYQAGYCLQPDVLRRLAATFIGRKAYGRSKYLVKSALRFER